MELIDSAEQAPDATNAPEVKSAVTQYVPFYAQFAQLEKDNTALTFAYDTPKGNKEARSHVYKLRQSKAALEKARKDAKAESIRIGKAIDSEAEQLAARVEAMIKIHTDPLEVIEKREADRVAALESRLNEIELLKLHGGTSKEYAAEIERVQAIVIDDSWQEFAVKAATGKDAMLANLRRILADAERTEVEAAELARLRAEAEARAKADHEAAIAKAAAEKARAETEAESKRIAAEAEAAQAAAIHKAQQEREAAERRELEAKQAAADAERRRAEAELKAAQDAKAAADRAEQQRQDAERARIAAEQKAEKDRIDAEARAKREAEAAVEHERQRAIQCVKEAPEGHCVVVSPPTRSNMQNALLWEILGAFSTQLKWPVNGAMCNLEAEEWKDILSSAFRQEAPRLAQGLNGGVVMLGARTSKMSKREFSEFIEFLYSVAAERGISV